jgi:hypothetical protein
MNMPMMSNAVRAVLLVCRLTEPPELEVPDEVLLLALTCVCEHAVSERIMKRQASLMQSF